MSNSTAVAATIGVGALGVLAYYGYQNLGGKTDDVQVGQLYNDQKIKGYTLIAAELFSLYSFNENRKKYKDYNESYNKSQDYYLRERNRFAWIAIGLYFYGILDSVVEAHLDDFDKIVKENDPQSETGDIDVK